MSINRFHLHRVNLPFRTWSPTDLVANELEFSHDTMLLVKNFAAIDVAAQDQNGRTLLHIAVLSNNDAACSILITHPQINVNAVDLFGRTPMFYAIVEQRIACAYALSFHPKVDMSVKSEGYYIDPSTKTPVRTQKRTILHAMQKFKHLFRETYRSLIEYKNATVEKTMIARDDVGEFPVA